MIGHELIEAVPVVKMLLDAAKIALPLLPGRPRPRRRADDPDYLPVRGLVPWRPRPVPTSENGL